MIKTIILHAQPAISWGAAIPTEKTMSAAIEKANERATAISRDYQKASLILDFLQYDHGVGSIEERLRNLPYCEGMNVLPHSDTCRVFKIGVLTITEED